MIGVTWPGVTEGQRNMGVLPLMTGLACVGDVQAVLATTGASIGPTSMVPGSMLLQLPMIEVRLG